MDESNLPTIGEYFGTYAAVAEFVAEATVLSCLACLGLMWAFHTAEKVL